MKIQTNKICEINIIGEYIDINGFVYEYSAYVVVNNSYEVESTRFSIIECFDETGEPIEIDIDPIVIQQLECMAGAKALEKVQSVDFERESEKE